MAADDALSFLIVEDDDLLSQGLTRLIAPYGRVEVALTASDAKLRLATRPWCALIIDLGLPDGSGLDVLARARAVLPEVPALVLTGSNSPAAINAAYDLRAHYLLKPLAIPRIKRFIENAARPSPALDRVLRDWEKRYRLSQAETDILVRAARGESREAMALGRGSSPLTVKKQAVTLLQKTSDESLHGAVTRLLRQAIGS